MPNHSAKAIANEFLRRRASDTWPQQLAIQKLTYIAHGWTLAVTGEPLISESAQAWDNGPVYRSIWDHIRDNGYRGKHCTLVDPFTKEEISEEITSQESSIIDHVWAKYGNKTPRELIEMTHRDGSPWYKAYYGDKRNASLSNDDIRDHYIKLAMAGRRE